MNSHRSGYKTDAFCAVKLLRHLDFGFWIADFGFEKKSAIRNPKSAIEMVVGVGIAPTFRPFQSRTNLSQLPNLEN